MSLSREARGILDLPDELLLAVFDWSRPDSFESLLFTCRRFFSVGSSLLEDHEFCLAWAKKWNKGAVTPEDEGISYVLDHFVTFIQDLVDAPPRYRNDALLYIHKVYAAFEREPEETAHRRLMRQVIAELPDLHARLLNNLELLPDLTEDFADVKDSVRRILMGDWAFGEMFHTREHIRRTYTICILLLLPNLRTIKFSPGDESCWTELLDPLFRSDLGLRHFRFVERVELSGSFKLGLNSFDACLRLPQLKALRVYALYQPELDPLEIRHDARNDDATLEQIILSCVNLSPPLVGQILELSNSLQSFVLEFFTPVYAESPEPEMFDHDEESRSFESDEEVEVEETVVPKKLIADTTSPDLHDSLKQFPMYREDYDSEDEELDEKRKITVISNGFVPFEAKQIVGLLAAARGETLKHLAICFIDNQGTVYQNYQIVEFCAFPHLTHLEFYIDVMRPSRICYRDEEYYWLKDQIIHLPRSLTKILPISIQVVRVVLKRLEYIHIHKLLRRTPHERSKFPHLRKIVIRLPLVYIYLPNYPAREENIAEMDRFRRLGPLREELEKVGIEVVVEFQKGIVEPMDEPYDKARPIEIWDD